MLLPIIRPSRSSTFGPRGFLLPMVRMLLQLSSAEQTSPCVSELLLRVDEVENVRSMLKHRSCVGLLFDYLQLVVDLVQLFLVVIDLVPDLHELYFGSFTPDQVGKLLAQCDRIYHNGYRHGDGRSLGCLV